MKTLGIYIHWPFCLSKCPYCDFNSHVRESIDEAAWQKALLTELDTYADLVKDHRIESLFFGGGTPSLLSAQTVQRLIERVYDRFPTKEKLEITLEANPTSIEAGKFKEFKKAGVNRVSVGIQSLKDEALKFLGRQHNADEAKKALEIAASTFDNFSFDLIYARPGQTVEQWQQELTQALSYQSPHLSLYQLTIEPNTAFATQFARGDFALPDEETSATLYEMTADIADAHGLALYEVSNYAKPGFESKHNTLYWEYRDYIGIGPGAHGRLIVGGQKSSLKNLRAPETWLKHVESRGEGIEEKDPLPLQQQIDECLLMGLRLKKGISQARLQELFGKDFYNILDISEVEWLQEQGFLNFNKENLAVTPKGRLCLNAIIQKIVL